MTDQAREGILSPFLRRQRMSAARRFLSGKVLDIGCGSGGLAGIVGSADYVGLERDAESIELARRSFPDHRFVESPSSVQARFECVVALAVIEHVPDPVQFLDLARGFMSDGNSIIVLSTPHPAVDWMHGIGARLGLFSSHASEEHETLLDKASLQVAAESAGLKVVHYERFLFGANQIVVLARA